MGDSRFVHAANVAPDFSPARATAADADLKVSATHANARGMRRMQDSNLREVRRLTSLLLKIKRHERQTKALEKTAAFHNMRETKGVGV